MPIPRRLSYWRPLLSCPMIEGMGAPGKPAFLPSSILDTNFMGSAGLAAEEKPPDLGVAGEFRGRPGERHLAGDEDIAEIGEGEALMGILLDHHNRGAAGALEIDKHLEDAVDSP